MQRVKRPAGCLSDLVLDKLATGELEASADHASAEQHLASCDRCAARHAELKHEHEAFLAQAPSFAAHAQLVSPRKPQRAARWSAAAGALAMAAIALLWLRTTGDRDRIDAPDTRSKGAPHLGLFIKRGYQVQRAASGAQVQSGDLLRFAYSSDRPRYLAILDLDGGSASIYFPPQGGTQAVAIAAGNDVALDFGVEQNGSAADERIYGVFCAEPFALPPLIEALNQDGRLPELSGCVVDVLVLQKQKAAP